MSSAACESSDQDSIDVERLIVELDKFEKLLKEGEESDGAEGVEASSSLQAVPSFLDKYLMSIAKTGNPLLPWKKVKTFIHHKIDSILTSFYEKYGIEDVDSQNLPPFNYLPAKEKLLQHFDSFTGAPFTIQRLCEILMDPGRHYRRTDKLLRGLEKNILVVSTIGRLSEDCSNPQQRLMLFNGLQLTNTFRSYRPPLPHHVDKFQSPRSSRSPNSDFGKDSKIFRSRKSFWESKGTPNNFKIKWTIGILQDADSERSKHKKKSSKKRRPFRPKFKFGSGPTKDDEEMGSGPRKRPSNGDETSAMDEDEESFDDECLKQDLDDEQIEDMDDIHPKLAREGSDGESDNYGLSINPAMWRKRKEEHLEDGHTKKIKLSDDDGAVESASPPPSSSRLTTIEKALSEGTSESLADDSMEVDDTRPPSANELSDKSDDEAPSGEVSYKSDNANEPKEDKTEEKVMFPAAQDLQKEESGTNTESAITDAQGDPAEASTDTPDSEKSTSPSEEEKTVDQTADQVKSQSETSLTEPSEETEDMTEVPVSSERPSSAEAVEATKETPSADDGATSEVETKSEDVQQTEAENDSQEEKKEE